MMFRRLGAAVTVIEQAGRIAAREDDDIADALTEILKEDGIRLRLGAQVSRVERDGSGIALELEGKTAERIQGSHLLVAVGRRPNTETPNLTAAGVAADERGYIRVSERLETNMSEVYALGDVNGGPPFTHISYDDYRIVRANLLDGGARRTTRDRMVAYTVFTDPQLGRVGLTERQARQQGLSVRVARLQMSHVARAIETDEQRGLAKAIVDGDTHRILGAAVLGVEGGEMAAVLQTAMMADLPYTALRDGVYAHPTLAEAMNNLFMTLD